MKALLPFVLMVCSTGCMPTETPAAKLTNDAYEVAIAARFGRMDIVVDTVKPEQREAYIEAHSEWGGPIRIVDLEYGGARIVGQDRAIVLMNISWQRIDESMLRSTAIKQTWVHTERRWMIDKEERVGGDKGLIRELDSADKAHKMGDSRPAENAKAADSKPASPEETQLEKATSMSW